MTYPSEDNADAKHAEKLQKYQQLTFEIRERETKSCYWLLMWRYETSDKPNWTTDFR